MINNVKRANESFIVGANSSTALATDGTALNTAAGNVNLSDKQLGILNASVYGSNTLNTMYTGSITVAQMPILQIVQGTSASASVGTASASYPLWVRPYEATHPINGKNNVIVTKQLYRRPQHSVTVIGNALSGNTNGVNVLSNTEYGLAISYNGRRTEEMFSFQQAAGLRTSFVTPDFTSTGLNLTTAQAVDYILTHTAYNINKQSSAIPLFGQKFNHKEPVLALLIDSKGTSTTRSSVGGTGATFIGGNGTAAAAAGPLEAGQSIHVLTAGGINYFVTLTASMASAIRRAAAAVYAGTTVNSGTDSTVDSAVASAIDVVGCTYKITPINLSGAGSVTAANGEADMLMLIGLDEVPVFVDFIPQVKTRLRTGFQSGFANTVRNLEAVVANEGQGVARVLDLLWKGTQGQRLYNLRHTEDPIPNFASPIDLSQNYVVYNIYHGSGAQIDTNNYVTAPYRELLCIPSGNSSTISGLDTAFNSWLASSVNNSGIRTLGD